MNLTPTIEAWNRNPLDTGPLYPFVGTELILGVLCLIFFLIFMIWKFRSEQNTYNRQVSALRKTSSGKPTDPGMRRAP